MNTSIRAVIEYTVTHRYVCPHAALRDVNFSAGVGGDSSLSRQYVVEEGGDEEPTQYLKASVTVKHFVSYNIEQDLENTDVDTWCGSPLNGGRKCSLPNDRHSFNAKVARQDLIETYAPAFEMAAKARAGAIMCR